jgi:broad specificity phosphatase PhoE
MGLSLYFLRHGETQASLNGTYCGSLDLTLTENGMQMATEFAAAYRSLDWQAIYVSPKK